MKKEVLVRFFNASAEVQESQSKLKTKFIYGLDRNSRLIKDEIEALAKLDVNPIRQEYSTKRKTIVDEYAEKDESGELIINEGNLSIPDEKLEEFNSKMKELDSEYFPKLQEADRIWNETLEEETDIKFYLVNIDYFPDELTPMQFRNLEVMLNDE